MTKQPKETGKILDFIDYRKFSDTFVETGTALFGGVEQAISAGFINILTVEAKDTYFQQNRAKLLNENWKCVTGPSDIFETFTKNDISVGLYFGMSQDFLPHMVNRISKPAVMWLDAHVSGPNSAGHEDYMEKGNDSLYAQDNVLTDELKAILSHRNDHIILIDDQNGMNDENKKYMAMILAVNPNYNFYFYDEKRGEQYYSNKCLVCIPE